MEVLCVYTFVTSCIGRLENIGPLNYANLLKMDTFHHKICFFRNDMSSNHHGLIRDVFKWWEVVKLTLTSYKFSQILNFTWKPEVYHWQEIVGFSSQSVRLTLLIFEKMSATYSSQLATLKFQGAFLGNNHHTLQCDLGTLPILSNRTLKSVAIY